MEIAVRAGGAGARGFGGLRKLKKKGRKEKGRRKGERETRTITSIFLAFSPSSLSPVTNEGSSLSPPKTGSFAPSPSSSRKASCGARWIRISTSTASTYFRYFENGRLEYMRPARLVRAGKNDRHRPDPSIHEHNPLSPGVDLSGRDPHRRAHKMKDDRFTIEHKIVSRRHRRRVGGIVVAVSLCD